MQTDPQQYFTHPVNFPTRDLADESLFVEFVGEFVDHFIDPVMRSLPVVPQRCG
jgi:hypothetical protein